MKDQIKLFIFIPTFNRPNGLTRQLKVLAPQLEKYKNHTRLIVCDNNSDGSHYEALQKKYQAFGNINFVSNFGNIGGNANISLGFVYAKPNEFLWILSDNDLVRRDALKIILEHSSMKADFILMNYEVDKPSYKKHYWSDGWKKPINWRMGLISATLFNTNSIKNSVKEAFFYHNSSFPHLAVAIASAKERNISNFLLLPIDKIIDQQMPQEKNFTDYKIGQVGMPQLVTLLPKEYAKEFCHDWIKQHAKEFYLAKHLYLGTFLSTKELLLKYGGARVFIYFFYGYLRSVFFPAELRLKKLIKKVIGRV